MTTANSTTIVVFSTSSSADLGIGEIFLTDTQLRHIQDGHRDISKLPITLIKEAVEQTTVVYPGHAGRYVFHSSHVQTRHGRPLAVVVERESGGGKIITATWVGNTKRPTIWDATSGLYSHFDKDADVLYLSRGDAVDSYAAEDDKDSRNWYRYVDEDNSHAGITFFGASQMGPDELTRISSDFLGLAPVQIAERIDESMSR